MVQQELGIIIAELIDKLDLHVYNETIRKVVIKVEYFTRKNFLMSQNRSVPPPMSGKNAETGKNIYWRMI